MLSFLQHLGILAVASIAGYYATREAIRWFINRVPVFDEPVNRVEATVAEDGAVQAIETPRATADESSLALPILWSPDEIDESADTQPSRPGAA